MGGDACMNVMFATSNFGCGVDVKEVRAVLHAGKPSSRMDFVQERGRAVGGDQCANSSVVL